MSPFLPDDAKNLISDPTSSLCGNFVRTLLRLPVLFYQWVSAFVADDGTWIRTVEPGDYIFSATPLAESDHRKLCNGQELSKTTYAILYAAIGDTYATMDGQSAPATGNFRVPKVGARFPLPVGTLPSATAVSLGGVGGAETVTLDATQVPDHGHDLFASSSDGINSAVLKGVQTTDETGSPGVVVPEYLTDGGGDPYIEPTSGGGQAHSNMPPWFGVYVYISTGL